MGSKVVWAPGDAGYCFGILLFKLIIHFEMEKKHPKSMIKRQYKEGRAVEVAS